MLERGIRLPRIDTLVKLCGSLDAENTVGFVIVGLFALTWIVALAIWRFFDIEERWTAQLEDSEVAGP